MTRIEYSIAIFARLRKEKGNHITRHLVLLCIAHGPPEGTTPRMISNAARETDNLEGSVESAQRSGLVMTASTKPKRYLLTPAGEIEVARLLNPEPPISPDPTTKP